MPLPHIDALTNIANLAKLALDNGAVKEQPPLAKATLWAQVANLEEFIGELRAAAQVPPPPAAEASPV